MKKFLSLTIAVLFSVSLFAGCSSSNKAEDTTSAGTEEASDISEKADEPEKITLKVGASPTPHAEILNAAKDILAKDGINLEVVEFVDYVQPNLALQNGDIDANYFQHLPYLEDFNAEKGTDISSAAAIHYEPLGVYPGKTKTLDELADGASVAVPNDTTNEARALLLLEANGLIKLNPEAGLKATINDITENPKNLDIKEIEAAQLARSLQDVDIAVINGNYSIEADLNPVTDSLAKEESDSVAAETFANIIAVRTGDEQRPEIQALVKALQSQEIKDFINEKYQGVVVPIF